MQPTETQGSGDIMTHNEVKARGSVSTPQYGASATRDAGHQRKGSMRGSVQSIQTRRDNEVPGPGWPLTTPDSTPGSTPDLTPDLTPEMSNGDDHDTPLYQPIPTPDAPYTIYAPAVLGSRSYTPSTRESLGQQQGHDVVAMPSRNFQNSPSPPKRPYNSISGLSTETTSSSPLALGVGGTPTVRDEMPSKQRRLKKQESVRTLLSSIPQFVPLPPSLVSPLRSTR